MDLQKHYAQALDPPYWFCDNRAGKFYWQGQEEEKLPVVGRMDLAPGPYWYLLRVRSYQERRSENQCSDIVVMRDEYLFIQKTLKDERARTYALFCAMKEIKEKD